MLSCYLCDFVAEVFALVEPVPSVPDFFGLVAEAWL